MKIVAIIQARMGSTRLPGKMMLPLAGKPLVQHVIERVQRATLVQEVVLAVPKEPDSAVLEAMADKTKCIYARFDHIPADDLVDRYLGAATAYRADLIVRVPGDNPCVDPAFLDEAIETYLAHPFVYYSNTTACVGTTWVDGVGAEVVSFNRLQWLKQVSATRQEWREHPHQYFVDQGLLCLPKADLRLDVNNQSDYEYVSDIFNHFGQNTFTATEVVDYLNEATTHSR